MIPRTLYDCAGIVGGRLIFPESADLLTSRDFVTSATIDSRMAFDGAAFFALTTGTRDGHDFVDDALHRGASVAVVGRVLEGASVPLIVVDDTQTALTRLAQADRAARDTLIVGVTGSVGKTTTKRLIQQVLASEHVGSMSPQNFNNHLGVPLSLLSAKPNDEFHVVELGASAAGDIAELCDIAEPEIGVITHACEAHLATFGDLRTVADTKTELLSALPASGLAFVNGDAPLLRERLSRADCPVILCGTGERNDFRAGDVRQEGSELVFRADGRTWRVPIIGTHQVTNILLAIALGLELGLQLNSIAESLRDFRPAPGRMSVSTLGPFTLVDDAYNASPASSRAAIETFSTMPTRAGKHLLLGDMLELGDRSPELHRSLGVSLAPGEFDSVIVFGDHADDLARGAVDSGVSVSRLGVCHSWEAVELLLGLWVEPGDAVLIKGSRGMRLERVRETLNRLPEPHAGRSSVPFPAAVPVAESAPDTTSTRIA